MTGLHKFVTCLVLLPLLITGCHSPRPAPRDVTDQRVLLVGFSPNADVRRMFEDRLQAELSKREVDAVPSHVALPDFQTIENDAVLAAADANEATLILMVRRVPANVDRYPADMPAQVARRMPTYRTLQDFLASYELRPPTPPPPGRQVVEVYGYTRDAAAARLIWSGFSWVDFDGNLERAIAETAELIASNMAQSRDAVRATLGDAP